MPLNARDIGVRCGKTWFLNYCIHILKKSKTFCLKNSRFHSKQYYMKTLSFLCCSMGAEVNDFRWISRHKLGNTLTMTDWWLLKQYITIEEALAWRLNKPNWLKNLIELGNNSACAIDKQSWTRAIYFIISYPNNVEEDFNRELTKGLQDRNSTKKENSSATNQTFNCDDYIFL